ncbi:hypothetical protein G9F73_012605 [Clostridium estertheticum]|uniref:sigma factor-like helix-turn-helix DNA-binding protein n=1 Tax=Clostridium estertheticum TaxID=238834 RepID=UPI0013EE72C9|nr:sigma factor-like helix-turn-helix DNA-binding protein [Clostridium estertheticum]MBZ9608649.1 hypothetical protein [Clostridium estertheticum]
MIGDDLEKQVELHELRKNMYITEKEYLLKTMMGGPQGYKPINYEGMPHGSGGTVTLDRDWEHMRKLDNMINLEQWAIDSLTSQIVGMNTKIKELKGLDAQVIALRDFKGNTLQEIADLLGYGVDRIKQVSCRNPRQTA